MEEMNVYDIVFMGNSVKFDTKGPITVEFENNYKPRSTRIWDKEFVRTLNYIAGFGKVRQIDLVQAKNIGELTDKEATAKEIAGQDHYSPLELFFRKIIVTEYQDEVTGKDYCFHVQDFGFRKGISIEIGYDVILPSDLKEGARYGPRIPGPLGRGGGIYKH